MPTPGPLELIIVLVIALIVFGPKRLPEMGRSIGKGIREFRSSVSGESDEGDEGDEDAPRISASGRSEQSSTARQGEGEPVEGEIVADKRP